MPQPTVWFENVLTDLRPWVVRHQAAMLEVGRVWDGLPNWARWALPLGVLAAVMVLGVVLSLDWSRPLSVQEAAEFAGWAQSTHSEAVVAALDAVRGDGRLTVNEANEVIEVAKAAAVPEGMMQPLGLAKP